MLRILGASLTVALACVAFVAAQPSGNKSVVNGVTMEGDSITADTIRPTLDLLEP